MAELSVMDRINMILSDPEKSYNDAGPDRQRRNTRIQGVP